MMNAKDRTANVYNSHVKNYVDKFFDLGLYKDTFDHLLAHLPANAAVLDLGCGPGNVVKYLSSKRSDLDILGIDLAPEMVREAKKHNPGSRFEVMDICAAGEMGKAFDAVIAAFCLPYLSYEDTDTVFRNFERLTKDNGLLYLSCMEGPHQRSGFEKTSFTGDDEMHINYYERAEIEERLREHFKIEVFSAKDYQETDSSVTVDMFFIARKLPGSSNKILV